MGKSSLGSNLGHLRQPIWVSHVGGRNPKAYRIRCQIRQGNYRWGGGFLIEKHTLTCTHVDTRMCGHRSQLGWASRPTISSTAWRQ